MNRCIGQPISYLRLERYRLNELALAETRVIDAHLQRCDACSACFAQTGEPIELLPLPVFPAPRRRAALSARFTTAFTGAAGLALAAAALLVFMNRETVPVGPGLEPPLPAQSRLHVRGGELAIELVRMAASGELLAPTHFATGDRFKVRISCPPDQRGAADVVVYQSGQAFFPLSPLTLEHCGNQLSMPGAFTLEGREPAQVCAVFDDGRAVARKSLRDPRTLPKHVVCEQLLPAAQR